MSVLESISKSLGDALRKMLRLPIVDEAAIKELVRSLQRALLQSDVNVNLVFELSSRVEQRAIREVLPPGISRREHVVKVLYEELTRFLGELPAKTDLGSNRTNVIMLVGIQGSGKTSGAVKLSRFYQKRGLKVGLVCADTFRPGAYEQITQLANRVNIEVYGEPGEQNPEKVARNGMTHFGNGSFNLVIVDTAGRHRNEKDLMEEMQSIAQIVKPDEIILVIDGTIGQQATLQSKTFSEATPIGSIMVTKLDGSARGGGALSAVAATGARIKFIGVGEGIEDLEEFVPANFVGRLLGMGDIKALVERVKDAEVKVSEQKARAILQGRFTLKDMYDQMESLRKMGPLKKALQMLPGSYSIPDDAIDVAEQRMETWRYIIQSMTKDEIEDPKEVDSSRARRIARGSGRTEREVKELVNQYFNMRKMMRMMRGRPSTILRRGIPQVRR
ncbi:MAG: signal recognition particle protein Srp54 [archaeon]